MHGLSHVQARRMVKAKRGGRIINVGSILGLLVRLRLIVTSMQARPRRRVSVRTVQTNRQRLDIDVKVAIDCLIFLQSRPSSGTKPSQLLHVQGR